MRNLKLYDAYLRSFLYISLSCILVFWVISLISVFYIHKKTSSQDVLLVSSFLEDGFTYTQDWDFIYDLWDSRPSLMALSIEGISNDIELYNLYSYRNYYKSFLPFQADYLINLDFILLDNSSLKTNIKLTYSLLPFQEFIYYSMISFLLFILIFIVYFIIGIKLSYDNY